MVFPLIRLLNQYSKVKSSVQPYKNLPHYQYWKSGVVDVPPGQFDPVARPKFRISERDKIVTIGSCFAQHLSKYIQNQGFNFYSLEQLPKSCGGLEPEVGLAQNFSALYGNVYTVRQALQLIQRSQGWRPYEHVWLKEERFFDPFRPTVFKEGFSTLESLVQERDAHLKIVDQLFRTCDIVVFTLGMTESWSSKIDGAVFPIAPGVVAGEFNEDLHLFRNFSFTEVHSDLNKFCSILKSLNPDVKVILTVSPVALNATFENQNVLVASSYSKSVLRAAAGEVQSNFDFVDYFPSFEIVANPNNHCRYLEDDLRNVTQLGVKKVMNVFQRHYLKMSGEESEVIMHEMRSSLDDAGYHSISQILCDEDLLDDLATK